MTKRDFELIAGAVREAYQAAESGAIQAYEQADFITEALATALRSTNPRFDRSRFLAACRGEDSFDSAGRTVRYASR